MPITWRMNKRAFRLKLRTASAYSARSPRAFTSTLYFGLRWPSVLRLCLLMCFVLLIGCAAPPEREVVVAMTEYAFLPPTIEVTAAERVRVVVRNIGRLEHDFVPDARGRALGLAQAHFAPGGAASNAWRLPAQ